MTGFLDFFRKKIVFIVCKVHLVFAVTYCHKMLTWYKHFFLKSEQPKGYMELSLESSFKAVQGQDLRSFSIAQ